MPYTRLNTSKFTKNKSSQFRSCVISYNLPLDSSKRQTPPFTESEPPPPPHPPTESFSSPIVSYFLHVTPPCLIWSTLKKKTLLCSLPILPMDCIMTVWSSLSRAQPQHRQRLPQGRKGKDGRRVGGEKRGNGAGFAVGGKQHAVFVSWSSISELLGNTIIGDSFFFFKETKKSTSYSFWFV